MLSAFERASVSGTAGPEGSFASDHQPHHGDHNRRPEARPSHNLPPTSVPPDFSARPWFHACGLDIRGHSPSCRDLFREVSGVIHDEPE